MRCSPYTAGGQCSSAAVVCQEPGQLVTLVSANNSRTLVLCSAGHQASRQFLAAVTYLHPGFYSVHSSFQCSSLKASGGGCSPTSLRQARCFVVSGVNGFACFCCMPQKDSTVVLPKRSKDQNELATEPGTRKVENERLRQPPELLLLFFCCFYAG